MSFTAKFNIGKLDGFLKKAKGLKNPIDRATAVEVGQQVVPLILSEIAAGTSPINGNGKFPAYKNPDRYPGKKKAHTPVNLRLSGEFLDSLSYSTYTSRSGYGTEIAYSSDQEIKEQGHREGARGQPKRPSLPSKSGESYTNKIQKIIQTIYNDRIAEILKDN